MRKRNLCIILVIFLLVAWAELPTLHPGKALEFLKEHPRRVQMWGAVFDYIKQHPWAGGGLGNFIIQFRYYVKTRKDTFTAYDQAHNEYLQVQFEMGVFGTLLLLGYGIDQIRRYRRIRRRLV